MNQHNRAARLCRLFFSTLYISSFTFGGGFVIVTLMKKEICGRAALDHRGGNAGYDRAGGKRPRCHRCQCGYPGRVAGGRAAGHDYCRCGHHSAAHGYPVHYLLFLQCVCRQRVCGAGAERDAGRGCGGHLRRCVQYGRQGHCLAFGGIPVFDGSSVCGQLHFGVNVVLIILAAALFGVVRAALARKRTV